MKNINNKILFSLLVTSQLSVAYAEDNLISTKNSYNDIDNSKTKNWNNSKIYIDANVKAGTSFWNPGLSDEDPRNSDHIITYETEGLSYYELNVNIGYSGSSIFSYSKLSSFNKTENQQDLLATNQSAEGEVDGYTMGFSPEAIVEKLGIDNKYINTALTYRFQITDNAFYGVATAEQDIVYADENGIFSGLFKDDIVSFKTTFKEQRHTVSSKYLDSKYGQGDSYMRFGLYQSEWIKPTSMGNRFGSVPVIEMAEYTTTGLTFVYTNYESTKVDGLNYDITIDYGFDNSFTSYHSDADDQVGEEESLTYTAVKIDASYKWVPIKNKYQTLAFIFGASVDWKQWGIGDGNENTEDIKLDAEKLYALYTTVEFCFGY